MAWLKIGTQKIDLDELGKQLLQSPDLSQELKKTLGNLDFSAAWTLIREIIPQLDKTRARDLVRFLMQDKVEVLEELLQDWKERDLAVECLGYLPSRKTVEILGELLSHTDDQIQLIAAGSLKNHTPRLVVPYLMDILLNAQAPPARIGEVLLAMGYLAEEALLEAYPKTKPEIKGQILELLTITKNPKCEGLIEEALKQDHLFLKRKALEAVASFALKDVWTEVVMCLAESDWSLRAKALQVLTDLGVLDAEEFVEPFLKDEDPWVQKCAQECLQRLKEIEIKTS